MTITTTNVRDFNNVQYKNFVQFAKSETTFLRFLLTIPLDAENRDEDLAKDLNLAAVAGSEQRRSVITKTEVVIYDGANPIFADVLKVIKPLITGGDLDKLTLKKNKMDSNRTNIRWEISEKKNSEYFAPLVRLIEKDLDNATKPLQEKVQNAVDATLARYVN